MQTLDFSKGNLFHLHTSGFMGNTISSSSFGGSAKLQFSKKKGRVVIIFKASHTRRLTLLEQLLEPATTSFKIHSNSLRSQQGVGENNIKTANYIYNLTAVRFILIIELSTLDKMTQSGNCEKCFQNCQHQNLAAVTRI